MKQCEICVGTKSILGMGGMHQICPKCEGKGYVESKEKLAKDKTKNKEVLDDESIDRPLENPIVVKKKGRPKKQK